MHPQTNTHRTNSSSTFRSIKYRVRSQSMAKNLSERQTLAEKPSTAAQHHRINSFALPHGTIDLSRGISTSGSLRVQRCMAIASRQLPSRTPSQWTPLGTLDVKMHQRSSYGDTVEQLINMKQSARKDNLDWRHKNRVSLPQMQQYGNPDSNFTMLDPIRQQIDFVQTIIDEAQCSLKQNRQEIQQISKKMKDYQIDIEKQQQALLNELKSKKQQFSALMRQQGVRHQQSVVTAKEGIQDIKKNLQLLGGDFDKTLSHLQNIQQTVFHKLPFELIENFTLQLEPFQQQLF